MAYKHDNWHVLIFDQMSYSPKKAENANKGKTQCSINGIGRQVDNDTSALFTLFTKNRGVNSNNIQVHSRKTKDEVIKELKKMDDKEYMNIDVFLFVFLSFLSDDKSERLMCESSKIPGVENDRLLSQEEIFNVLKDLQLLVGKPKLVLIQADDVNLLPKPKTKDVPVPPKTVKIPTDADRLIMMSSIPQYYARQAAILEFGSTQDSVGSLLIQAFIEEMDEHRQQGDNDLLTRTTYINRRVKRRIDMLRRNEIPMEDLLIPITTSTLRNNLPI